MNIRKLQINMDCYHFLLEGPYVTNVGKNCEWKLKKNPNHIENENDDHAEYKPDSADITYPETIKLNKLKYICGMEIKQHVLRKNVKECSKTVIRKVINDYELFIEHCRNSYFQGIAPGKSEKLENIVLSQQHRNIGQSEIDEYLQIYKTALNEVSSSSKYILISI